MPTKTEAKSQSPCSADARSTKRKKESESTWQLLPGLGLGQLLKFPSGSLHLNTTASWVIIQSLPRNQINHQSFFVLAKVTGGYKHFWWWLATWRPSYKTARPGSNAPDRSHFGKACWTHQIFGDFCPYKMKDTERSANLKWMKFLKTAKHQSAFRVCDVSECYSSVTCSKNCSVWNSSVSTYWHSETISFMHLWPVSLISALIHAGAKIIYIYTVYIYNYIQNVIVQVSCSKCRKPSKHCHEFKHRQTLLTSPMHFWGAIACEWHHQWASCCTH